MKGVWIVTRVNEPEYWAFSSAEKAYDAIRNYILEYENLDEIERKYALQDLDADYQNYPSNFGVEGYARAAYCEVD